MGGQPSAALHQVEQRRPRAQHEQREDHEQDPLTLRRCDPHGCRLSVPCATQVIFHTTEPLSATHRAIEVSVAGLESTDRQRHRQRAQS